MTKFFMRERFGQPQFIAALLLLVFMGQCFWLLVRGTQHLDVSSDEMFRVQEGLRQWQGRGVAGTPSQERLEAASSPPPAVEANNGYDPYHSPLWYLIASSALVQWHGANEMNSVEYWAWLARLPYVIFGVLLGASLWYVARRLYGNAGGYIALGFYCFSPAILRHSTLWAVQPEMAAAWGTFGAIFTAIAVAHTLYAPREVVLWNWRRIVLLGLSLVLAVGCQFSLILIIPVTLAFMLYVAPTRRMAALAIWAGSCAVALFLFYAAYAFHAGAFWQGIHHAHFFGVSWHAFAMKAGYEGIMEQIVQSGPAFLLVVPMALVAYLAWPRARYFGNTAPLLVIALFFLAAVAMPHYDGAGFRVMMVPFLFLFVAGISADLLETRQRGVVLAVIWGLLSANALWNVMQLAGIGRG